jgi:fucose 4-O-acetylase-like acetyltransferase
VLLVVWHVIGSGSMAGLHVADDSFWRLCVDFLIYFRMPGFAFLAGYTYALHPAVEPKRFLAGKVRRLLVPMLVVGTLFAVTQTFVPGTNLNFNRAAYDWTMLHIIPVAHFWFIESIFIIFAAIAILDAFPFMHGARTFALVVTAATVAHFSDALPMYFGLRGALYLLPYFLCGLGCRRFDIRPSRLLMPLVIFGYGLAFAGLLGLAPHTERISLLALFLGASAPLLLLHSGWQQPIIQYVGVNSYAIFLFHPFFSAAARILLHAMGVGSIAVLFVTGTRRRYRWPDLDCHVC